MTRSLVSLLAGTFILCLMFAGSAWADRDQKPAVKVTGTYDSNWGTVYLEQSGRKVMGRYECCGGGRIIGVIDGAVIRYRWIQSGAEGRGVWSIRDGGKRLVGTWGNGKSEDSGGAWNLERRGSDTQTIAR